MNHLQSVIVFAAATAFCTDSFGLQHDPQAAMKIQREKLLLLNKMDGVWRGDAWIIEPNGSKVEILQTERVGNMLDGTVKIVEGRGYDSGGKVVFNALGIMGYDPASNKLSIRSYAQGRVGDFPIEVTDTGFSWKIPAGPMTIHYIAKIGDGKWVEYGERIVQGQDPVRFFEMSLKRVGDTEWPATDFVPFAAADSHSETAD